MEEDNKEVVMDQSGDDKAEGFKIPENANETIYITNLNEKVKLDGESCTIWTFFEELPDADSFPP
jgi:hypothetical protein